MSPSESPPNQTQVLPLPSGRNIGYQLSGPENAPLLILSNPLLTNLTIWDPLIPTLHVHNYRVLRYDNPGHGSSSAPPLDDTDNITFALLAGDLLFLLNALHISSVHTFIGASMGGATGVYLATLNPGIIKNLIICDTGMCAPVVAGIEDPFARRVEMARINADGMKVLTEQALERWFGALWRSEKKEEVERMRGLMRTTTREGFIACCHALRDRSYDLRPLLGALKGAVERVLFVVGGVDADFPQVMEKMRNSVMEGMEKQGEKEREREVGRAVIRGSGHLPMIDNPERFLRKVLKFLES
ncbi:hypothetical protein AJ79_04944 [Helicocarpus griseus UAMH5409]|uniref:AB hydrolase-1 domain-containing protein n=1 Tax=Helicocarpus griseus UAMH5409 TaxID=1447875 RepID=A0A2B7XRV5_9EURO|nr:hypothetical protein AJ79_04944 [Helicocarpus griseus UAMH5409]